MERKKRVNVVRLKAIEVIKEGAIQYLPRKFASTRDCVDLVRKHIDDSDREMFLVITLDTNKESANSYSNSKYWLSKCFHS